MGLFCHMPAASDHQGTDPNTYTRNPKTRRSENAKSERYYQEARKPEDERVVSSLPYQQLFPFLFAFSRFRAFAFSSDVFSRLRAERPLVAWLAALITLGCASCQQSERAVPAARSVATQAAP